MLFQIEYASILFSVFHLRYEIFSTFLVLLVQLVFLIFDLLASTYNLVLLFTSSLFKYHFLAVDAFYGFSFAICSSSFLLLLLLHEVLNQLLGERELARVLFILLLQVLKEHLAILIIELVQVDHHLFILLIFIFLLLLLML